VTTIFLHIWRCSRSVADICFLFFFGRESLKRVEKQLLKVQAANQKVVSELERDQSIVFVLLCFR